jgi:hypothetical protein
MENQVWINVDKPDVLKFYSRTALSLQEGLKAVNWAIHDMRLARQDVSNHFLVQLPVKADRNTLIRVDFDSRPQVEEYSTPGTKVKEVVADLMKQLDSEYSSSMAVLQTIKHPIKMHLDFGQVNIRRRKKGADNKMSYTSFMQMALQYGTRGGAELDTR